MAHHDVVLSGLQLFPYELVDEGAERVVEVALEAYGAKRTAAGHRLCA
jgi:hypothetical protein